MLAMTSSDYIRTFFVGDKEAELSFNPLEGLVAKVKSKQGSIYIPSHNIEGVPAEIKRDPVALTAFFKEANCFINSIQDNGKSSFIIHVNLPLKGGGNDIKKEYNSAEANHEKKFYKEAIIKYHTTILKIEEAKREGVNPKKEIELNTILRDSYFSLAMCHEQLNQLEEALQNFNKATEYGRDAKEQIKRITLRLGANVDTGKLPPNETKNISSQPPAEVKKTLVVPRQNFSLSQLLKLTQEKVLKDESTQRLNDTYTPLKCVDAPGVRSIEERGVDLLENFNAFMKGDKKVFLVLGEAGGGKSYFLQYIEKIFWENFNLEDSTSIIPIRIELSTLNNPVSSAVAEHLSHKGFTENQIQELKHNHRVLIILDGYDDARFNGAPLAQNLVVTNKLKEWNGKAIISGRLDATDILNPLSVDHLKNFSPIEDDRFRTDLVEEVFICPFFPSQIEEYIDKCVEHVKEDLKHKYPMWFENSILFKRTISQSPSLKTLVKTPFVLRSVIEGFPRINIDQLKGPIGKFEVYKAFTEECFEREEVKFSKRGEAKPPSLRNIDLRKLANTFCKNIAVKMIESEQETCSIVYTDDPLVIEEWGPYLGDSEECIFLRSICSDIIRKSTILVDDFYFEQYYFAHSELRDYFQSL